MDYRQFVFLALLPVLGATRVLGNGGGYFHSGIGYTGTISFFEPSGTQKVRIMDEVLTVDVGQTSAQVEVRYVLKNQTSNKAKVRFGFPVEELSLDRNSLAIRQGEGLSEEEGVKKPSAPTDCRNYSVNLGGKKLDAKFQGQPAAPDERYVGIRGWFVSEATFGPSEEKTMIIRYESDYAHGGASVSDDSFEDPRIFKYRLSTGAVWDGPIERGRVILRGVGLAAEEFQVLKPVNRFRKTAEGWEWSFENLEPTLADDLEIQAVSEVRSYGYRRMNGQSVAGEDIPPVTFKQVGKSWRVVHHNYAIKASSELPPFGDKTYKAEHVRGKWEGVWCEGSAGNGVGEWLELTPEVAQPLDSIEIRPGYALDDALYRANARPRVIEVSLNDSHVFDARLADDKEPQRIVVAGYDKPVSKIRLTIKEVYPGSRHKDMCIAEVALAVRLDKAPKVQPAR